MYICIYTQKKYNMQIKDILKFTFLFLSSMIVENRIKFIVIIATIACFVNAGTIPDTKNEKIIIDTIIVENSIGNDYLYITSDISNHEVDYKLLKNIDKSKIINGIYHYSSYNDVNIVLWTLFGFGCIILIIGLFMDDNEGGWNISENWHNTIELMVICEEENGKYYYTCFGRLLESTEVQLNPRHSFYIKGFNKLNRLPKWSSKQSKREKLLNQLDV